MERPRSPEFPPPNESDDYNKIDPISLYHHEPLSPPTGAEQMFLGGLETSTVSANALAEELKQQTRPLSTRSSAYSGADDFATAVESAADLDDHSFENHDHDYSLDTIESVEYQNFDPTPEESPISRNTENMATTIAKTTVPTTKAAPVKPLPKKVAPAAAAEEPTTEEHIDVASHIYEGAKGAWGWGKGVFVVSPFLGLAEGIASKVVGVVGTDLEEIDSNIKPQIANIDNGILNPAIEAVVGVVLGAVGKTEDIVKPIIFKFLTPFGLIEEEKKEDEPELTN